MHQASEGRRNLGFFWRLEARIPAIPQLWQGIPNTPGSEQDVAGVKVIPAASCHT